VALDVDHKCLTSDLVAQAHAVGYRVCCYTPNDPARVRELGEWGVDTIITDAVDAIPADSLPQADSRT
jgi:glycerophosphoryl diester phosphodiesterase